MHNLHRLRYDTKMSVTFYEAITTTYVMQNSWRCHLQTPFSMSVISYYYHHVCFPIAKVVVLLGSLCISFPEKDHEQWLKIFLSYFY